jgi:hypothetical protein
MGLGGAGLQQPLAMTRLPVLPSSMHKPWQDPRVAEFRGSIPFTAGQPVQSIHPRYLSVYASTRLLPDALQHSIPGLWLAANNLIFEAIDPDKVDISGISRI